MFALSAALVVLATACSDDATGPTEPPDPTIGSVTVTPDQFSLSPTQTVQLTAEVRDSAGELMPDQRVTWSSDRAVVAIVDSTGLVTGVGEGGAIITATAGGVSGSADIGVIIQSICDCTVVFDSTKVSLVSRDSASGRYVFEVIDGPVPELDTTNVIVGTQDGGFLRHVNAVETSGNTIELETSQAGLANAVENGAFGGSTQIFAGEETSAAAPTAPGETWWGPAMTEYIAPGVTEVSPGRYNLSGTSFKVGLEVTGSPELEFKVEDGALNFGPTLDLGASIGFGGLEEFHAIYRGGLSLTAFSDENKNLEYSVKFGGKYENKKTWPIVRKVKRFLFWIGWVPVYGELIFELKAVAAFEAGAAIQYTGEFGAGFSVTGGARYKDSKWSPVSGSSAFFDSKPPNILEPELEVETKLKFSFVPELNLKFYAVAGPFVNIDPHLLAPATFNIPAYDFNTRIEYGTDFNFGFRIEVFRHQEKKDTTGPAKFLNVEFGQKIPLHTPIKLAELFSDGPMVVTNTTSGDDRPPDYGLSLRPAYEINDAIFGRKHSTSTQDDTLALDSVIVLNDIRSGGKYLHAVWLSAVQGNCTVLSPKPDTILAVESSLRLAKEDLTGDPDTATVAFSLHCIPFGAMKVETVTGGPDPDPDGYSLIFTRTDTVGTAPKYFPDASPSANAAPSSPDTISVGDLDAVLLDSLIPVNPPPGNGASGAHELNLTGIRENCAVARPATHAETALSGDTINTTFEVQCIALGHLKVRTNTSDPETAPPSDSLFYQASVFRQGSSADSTETVAANDSTVVSGLIPLYNASGSDGRHTAELPSDGFPNRCTVDAWSRNATILSGDTAVVQFTIDCVERVHVRTRTTGSDLDPDGYEVVIRNEDEPTDARVRAIGTDEMLGISGVTPGTHTITLTGLTASCLAAADSMSVEVSGTDSTVVSFDVTCGPPPPPTGLTAQAISDTQIALDWSPPEIRDGVIASYNIYRDGAGTPVANTSDSTYVDSGLSAGATYSYRVSSVTVDDVEGPQSASATATTFSDPPVQDSVVFAIQDVFVTDIAGETERSLGTFTIPEHIEALGVDVFVEIGLSGDDQMDEAFAVGTLQGSDVTFIGDGSCPVVPDDPSLGRGWVRVGKADLAEGDKEFVARHAIEFNCYDPVDGFATPNSVALFQIRLVFWRAGS
jgi:hypothetical protein